MSTSETQNDAIPLDIQRLGPLDIAKYQKLLSESCPAKFAEMVVCRQPPGVRGTDRSLMEGRLNQQWLDDMPRDHAQHILGEARRAGVSASGKFYMSGLADKRGPADPGAWVDSVSDVKRVAKARNLTVTGICEHKGEPVPRPKPKRLSARLTREMMAHERRVRPDRKISDGDLKEFVKEKYGRKHKK